MWNTWQLNAFFFSDLHNTLAIPTHPSSYLVCWTEIKIIALMRRRTLITMLAILTAFDGTAKKIRVNSKLTSAKLA